MSKPATPLDNQAAIAQINQSINFIIAEIIRPTALQTQANAQAIDQLTADLQITRQAVGELTSDLQLTRQVVDDLAAESLADGRRSANNSANIENLLAESREDRRRSDERFAAQQEDRRRSDERFAAQQEVLQRLLLEVRSTNGAVAGLSDRVDGLERAS
jgi:hypothetical protein